MKLDIESAPAIKALAQHILAHALEDPDTYHDHMSEGIDWEYGEWTPTRLETDGSTLEVEAIQETTEAEKVRNARYNPPGKAHPAEYKHHDVELIATARVDWSEHHIAGETSLNIDQRGGAPQAPDPEPEWHGV